MDCPICYELVQPHTNCVLTECGHTFHTSCLLKHTVFNGYNCPFCRACMAVDTHHATGSETSTVDDERLSRDIENHDENMDDFDTTYKDDDLYVLDGFRWMWQRANDQIVDDYDDPYSDAFERWRAEMDDNSRNFESEVDSRSDRVLAELAKIRAFSYEDLLKGYMFAIDDYFGGSTKFATYDRKITSTLYSVLEKII